MLSPILKTGGKTYTSRDGVEVSSGEVTVGGSEKGATPYSSSTRVNIKFGSSYTKSVERWQYWYDGYAYASGKKDYRSGTGTKRVMEVCFKYKRNGKDLISWQFSRAAPGPVFGPGKVVEKTVRDTLNPVAPKTTFHYSVKAY